MAEEDAKRKHEEQLRQVKDAEEKKRVEELRRKQEVEEKRKQEEEEKRKQDEDRREAEKLAKQKQLDEIRIKEEERRKRRLQEREDEKLAINLMNQQEKEEFFRKKRERKDSRIAKRLQQQQEQELFQKTLRNEQLDEKFLLQAGILKQGQHLPSSEKKSDSLYASLSNVPDDEDDDDDEEYVSKIYFNNNESDSESDDSEKDKKKPEKAKEPIKIEKKDEKVVTAAKPAAQLKPEIAATIDRPYNALAVHDGRVTLKAGALQRLERATLKYEFKNRYFTLDANYLTVYKNYESYQSDKFDGKIRLYDIERLEWVERVTNKSNDLCFALTTKDAKMYLHGVAGVDMSEWTIAIDSLAKRSSPYETNYATCLAERDFVMKQIYFQRYIKGGTIKYVNGSKIETWHYSTGGIRNADDKSFVYEWNGEVFKAAPLTTDYGKAVWDGIWLNWFNTKGELTARYLFNEVLGEYKFLLGNPPRPDFVWLKNTNFAPKDGDGEWLKDGAVPPPIPLALHLLKWARGK